MMTVEACSSPNLKVDMGEEDDEPLVFKRSGSSSRQGHSQPSGDRKKLSLSSQKHGTQPASAKPISDARPANGESSNSQKGRIGIQAKASPLKSPLSSTKASCSPAKVASINSSTTNSKPSGPSTDKGKQLTLQKSSKSVEDAKPSVQCAAETNSKPSGPSTDKGKQLTPQKSSKSVEDAKPSIQRAAETISKSSGSSTDKAKQLTLQKSCKSVEDAKPSVQCAAETNSIPSGPSTDKAKQLTLQKSSKSVEDTKPSVQCAAETNSKPSGPSTDKAKQLNPQKSSKSVEDAKPSAQRATGTNSKPSGPSTYKAKQLNPQKSSKSVEVAKPSVQRAAEVKSDSEDSDDERPLRSRVPVDLSRGNSSHSNKETPESISGQQPNIKQEDDSDDEKPLSFRLPSKPVNGKSKREPDDSDDDKPLAAKRVQNGSAPRDSPADKFSTPANKRPGVAKSSSQPPVKKAKLSDACTPSDGKKAIIKAKIKAEDDDEDDDIPISHRIKKPSSSVKKVTKIVSSSSRKTNVKSKKITKKSNYSKSSTMLPGSGEGKKWTTLIHNGVIFPPPYKPHGVKMLYKKQPVDLTPEQEEVATMFAVMLDTEYMTKPQFRENFFNDWKKILGKNHIIQKLEDCDFSPIYEWHQGEKEKKKQMTTEEKKALKEEKLMLEEKYMWAIVDGTKEKVGNFRVEPPGLFRGRGEHPRMGRLKKRIRPSDIVINIGKNVPVPECPIPGERWKEVRHDNTVTWLAYWNDPINPKEFKYVFLAASSTLKGQSDKEKYEKARKLKDYIEDIRKVYTKDFTNKDSTKKQIAVATYLIDKLALRAGNEKDDDEADTVGCCTLKVENVEPVPPNILKFDFLGKDSIRYQNEVKVERPAFEAIQQFRKGKKGGDDLFDELDTAKLNTHLKELMPGLTAKVFRTYNASITLDDMLSKETKGADINEKIVVYQHANKEVAIICNHQRTVSKSHSAQMTRLDEKIGELKTVLEELEDDLSRAKKGKPPSKSPDGKAKRNLNPEALERKIAQTNAKIEKMGRDKETKEDLKTVALGTSKINYLDPRITVAWCKRHEVAIEKIFNKSLLAKFAWAMDVDPSFRF